MTQFSLSPSKWTLLGLFAWVFSFSAWAQSDFRPGYVVSLAQDTMPGYILYQRQALQGRQCIFRSSLDGEKQRFEPEEIRGYGYREGRVYHSGKLENGKAVFLECFFDGALTFYYLRDSIDIYLVRERETLIPLVNTREEGWVKGQRVMREKREYQGVLNRLMQRPELFDQIGRTRLEKNQLIRLGERYQRLVAPDEEIRTSFPEGENFRIRPEGVLGVYSQKAFIDLSRIDYVGYRDQLHPTIGLGFVLEQIPYFSDRLSLRVSAMLYQFGPNSIWFIPDYFPALRLPLEAEYHLGRNRLYPSLAMGFVPHFTLIEKTVFVPRNAWMAVVGGGLHFEGKRLGLISLRTRYELQTGSVITSLGVGL